MYGAIIGDIVGSIYEFTGNKKKNIPLFSPYCEPTDDSVMTVAVAEVLLNLTGVESEDAIKWKFVEAMNGSITADIVEGRLTVTVILNKYC